MKKTISNKEFKYILNIIADNIEENKDYLCELDRAIGDGDHGVTMSIGWNAIKDKLKEIPDDLSFDKICMQVATSFLNSVGASAGPLYATALIRGGSTLKGLLEINTSQLADFFISASNGIQERGKAELGDKTMLDVWIPTAIKIKNESENTNDLIELMKIGSEEANFRMLNTKEMLSKKGRSSKLGERSLGFIDPGAASSEIMINSIYQSLINLDNL